MMASCLDTTVIWYVSPPMGAPPRRADGLTIMFVLFTSQIHFSLPDAGLITGTQILSLHACACVQGELHLGRAYDLALKLGMGPRQLRRLKTAVGGAKATGGAGAGGPGFNSTLMVALAGGVVCDRTLRPQLPVRLHS